ncbi:CotH kinase family protein [Anaerotruncus massiliensis (ex Togo et al. 2019)]|uniref:CotH kinase family protein n=1 Tax=Anaerotruncus massiliensis (ex Togo et al. 2019) TaxID=1673720 RepID=UPI0027BA2469|nr:CotH kinase family protein [Anaerotruncus massiliensis (ex Togo et al. 2019)]
MTGKRYWLIAGAAMALAVLLLLGMLWMPASLRASLEKSGGAYADRLFGKEIVSIDIQMDPGEWDDMIENARQEEYVSCDVTIDGTEFSSAAIRPKGNTSLTGIAGMDSERFSFKIRADKYVDGQSFWGLSKLVLNNSYADPTYMKEALSYDLMDYLGIPAPLCTYAEVTVNGEPFGLYLLLEAVEEEFAERSFGGGYGQLYKPESEGGGGRGSGNDLVYSGDDPESYAAVFENAVFRTSDEDERRVVEALAHLDSGENLEAYIDVDEVLRYFAANVFLVNLDSYLSNLKHNYYLYEEDGRLSMLPWDYNLSFGAHQLRSASDAVNFPIDDPYSGTSAEKSPILQKLLEVEEYRARYHGYLRQIAEDYVGGGRLTDTIERVSRLISPHVQTDATALYSYEEYDTAVVNLKLYVLLRAESVLGQLDGSIPSTGEGQKADPSALVDASALNFSAMGGMNMGGGRGGNGSPPGLEEGARAGRGQRREGGRDGEPPAEAGRPAEGEARPEGEPPPGGGQQEARTADAEAAPPALPSGGPASPGDEGQVRQGNVPGGDGGGFPGGGPGGEFPGGQARQQFPTLLLLEAGGGAVLLLAALLIVRRFRRRKQGKLA